MNTIETLYTILLDFFITFHYLPPLFRSTVLPQQSENNSMIIAILLLQKYVLITTQ